MIRALWFQESAMRLFSRKYRRDYIDNRGSRDADRSGLGNLIVTSVCREEPFPLVPILGVISQGSRNLTPTYWSREELFSLVPDSEADRSGYRNPIITYWSRLFTLVGLLTGKPPPRYQRPTLSHYPPPLFSVVSERWWKFEGDVISG